MRGGETREWKVGEAMDEIEKSWIELYKDARVSRHEERIAQRLH